MQMISLRFQHHWADVIDFFITLLLAQLHEKLTLTEEPKQYRTKDKSTIQLKNLAYRSSRLN